MEILILAIIIGLIPATIAHSKGRSFMLWWFYGAMLWIVALPVSICLKSVESYMKRKCPKCGEYIQPEASICIYCKSEITSLTRTEETALVEAQKRQDNNVSGWMICLILGFLALIILASI